MILIDEPGPLELIPLAFFPKPRPNLRTFETLATPVSRQLDKHADAIGATGADMVHVATLDINPGFARTIPQARQEVGAQLATMADADPGRMLSAVLESLGEANSTAAAAIHESHSARVSAPGAGSTFGHVQWLEAGAGLPAAPGLPFPGAPAPAPPPSPGGPTIPDGPSVSPPGGEPDGAPDTGTPPAPLPPGEPSPPAPEPEQPLI